MTTPDVPLPARPRPLLWLYGLLTIGLVGVGVAAGNILFNGIAWLTSGRHWA